MRAQRLEEAAEHFGQAADHKCLVMDLQGPTLEDVDSWHQVARMYAARGDVDKAASMLQQARF